MPTYGPRAYFPLTLACGKYRFNKLEFGDIEGLPRLVGLSPDDFAVIDHQVYLAT